MAGTDAVVDRLGRCKLFQGVPPKTLKAIRESGKERTFRDGDEVTHAGDGGGRLYVILDGRAKVRNKGRTIRTLGPGDSLGEISLLDGEPRSATVVASGPVSTWSITSWNFKPLMRKYPTISEQVIAELCRIVRGAGAASPTG